MNTNFTINRINGLGKVLKFNPKKFFLRNISTKNFHIFNFKKRNEFLLSIQRKGKFNNIENNSENKEAESDWITLSEPIIFKDNKFNVLIMKTEFERADKISKYFIINPLILFFSYFSYLSIIKQKFLQLMLNSIGLTFFIQIRIAAKIFKKKLIFEINLMESGKEIEIKTLDGEILKFDIKDVRNSSEDFSIKNEKFLKIALKNDKHYGNFISLKNEIYIIPKSSSIFNTEIFEAIKNGKYIKMKNE